MILLSIPSPPINSFHIGPLRVTFYGIAIAVGVALGWRLTVNRYRAAGGDPDLADRVLTRMVIFGFLGARAAYVSTHLDRFRGEWWKVIAIWEGGLALFGGLTVGAITVWYLIRRWGGDLPAFLDGLAAGVPLAQAVGRWGNYFNQELFGTPTDLPWGLEIDPAHRPDAYATASTFHPTFLYESLWNFALAGMIVWLGRRVPALRGRLIAVYFAGYGLMRFLLELIRTDTTFRFLGLSRNGWVAAGAFLLGITGILWRRAKDPSPVVDEA
ncbi:MAG: prolipoprotein diacylglyceryl transferase [Acidimicrobiia bacterium]|nr:prolipoprotein diacylglyceryl transferase [Acidimicrobiia bacterium]MDH4309075.1 prolipoprotein diacylglyceryl transferase [Acidimicrobiia bacterium]MDH5293101.1 prolipoprotein diacylglyceryl transferase [Acidimicrobiia bacterium]